MIKMTALRGLFIKFDNEKVDGWYENKKGVVAEHKNLQQPFYDAYESKNERKKGKANTTC